MAVEVLQKTPLPVLIERKWSEEQQVSFITFLKRFMSFTYLLILLKTCLTRQGKTTESHIFYHTT